MTQLIIFFTLFSGALFAKINLHFQIDENYLIAHTLYSPTHETPSSEKNEDSIFNFFKEVAEKFPEEHEAITTSWLSFKFCDLPYLEEWTQKVKALDSYQPILKQTLEYKEKIEKEWNETYEIASTYVANATGLTLDRDFDVFLTHPSLRNGVYHGNNQITWGCTGTFPHYDIVYLWHEILHGFLPRGDLSHCANQLVSDNGIRHLLNPEEEMFPLIGHLDTIEPMKKLYPDWEQYHHSPGRNILQWIEDMDEKYPELF